MGADLAVERRLADAREARKRRRRRWLIGGGIALVVLAALCVLWARPAILFDVDGDALASSLIRETGGTTLVGRPYCTEKPTGVWYCGVPDAGGSGGGTYRLTTHGLGCWDANRIGPRSAEGGTPSQVSGCVDMSDVAG